MCTRLSLLFAIVYSLMLGVALPTQLLRAQGDMSMGMGMEDMMMSGQGMGRGMDMYGDMDMGMGSMAPPLPSKLALKVTILLGPDYDFETKPFMTVQDVLKCFQEDFLRAGRADTGISATNVLYFKPTSGLIDLDMKLSIPDKPERHVVARMPEGLKAEEVDGWKRKIRLNALRFGLNRVTFLPGNFSIPKDQSTIWLQVPVGHQNTLRSNMNQHVAIALDLAEASESNGSRPRIDLFYSEELANHNPFGGADPFGGSGGNPYSASGGDDPFAAPAGKNNAAMNDPFSEPAGANPFGPGPSKSAAKPKADEALQKVVKATETLRDQLQREIKQWSENGSANGSAEEARVRELLIKIENEQIQGKLLHVKQLQKQLQQISESIEELSRPEAVEQRVQKQLELLENKLE
ncbi:hypothetical protein LOC71_16035 [Rhodopirellula sp. JC740]|uniref:Uncharacterized protein n=1 Tax=Rhodopirellula halodulae TaxID=2894198 RepID=A0ABS8NMV2_9BACT|nr:hypothetical protein [Rhodopirellula sp. JC740]MCC9643796.1 hypothetical protein [Rhodopirellula sp. JC740]